MAEFLEAVELSQYLNAFTEEGWDSVSHLRCLGEGDLAQLIADTQMKSGHAARLRSALGRAIVSQPAPAPPAPPAPLMAHVSVEPSVLPSSTVPATPPKPSVDSDSYRKDEARDFRAKLFEWGPTSGDYVHGTIVQTYQNPATNTPIIVTNA